MSTALVIRWIERAPDLYEARVTLPDGRDLYVGYVASAAGAVVWRGYVGPGFEPVGAGARDVMQRAVEQRGRESMEGALETVDHAVRGQRIARGGRD